MLTGVRINDLRIVSPSRQIEGQEDKEPGSRRARNVHTPRSLLQFAYPPRPPRHRLPFDGFFERDAPDVLSALRTHPGVTSEKALALYGKGA